MIPERLETTHLKLRPFVLSDAHAVFAYWRSDPGWEQFNASVPSQFSEADAERFVEEMCARNREDSPNWAVVHRGSVVGIVSLTFEQGHRIAVVGYGIHGDLRGLGLTCEAVTAVLDAAFSAHAYLGKIRAHTDSENAASMRVLEKLGFVKEDTLKKSQFIKGRFRDEAVFGLLRGDWSFPTDHGRG